MRAQNLPPLVVVPSRQQLSNADEASTSKEA